MDFKKHSDLIGKHSVLSASQHAWVRYNPEKLFRRYETMRAAQLGTEKHEVAKELIRLGIKLPNTTQTLNMFVNDSIAYRMKPEQVLFYSYNAFGTADAIGFDVETKVLRIFDLKTGVGKTSEEQLEVYAAYFCLEYNLKPHELGYDLRIYQNDECLEFETDPDYILHIMDTIVEFNKLLEQWKSEDLV